MGRGLLSIGANATCSTPLEPARWDDSNGIDHAVIASEPMELPLNIEMVGERLGGARAFEFWCYCNVLYTIGTGSMRRFHWYRPRCDSTKTHGATPKYGALSKPLLPHPSPQHSVHTMGDAVNSNKATEVQLPCSHNSCRKRYPVSQLSPPKLKK